MMYKLLIVDDEKLIREGLVDYIDWRALAIEIVGTAASGDSALDMVKQHRPDIILSDIAMPNMDGITLIQRLRQDGFDCEVVFISAYSEFKYAQQAVRLGAFDYLLKPIEEQTLIDCMSRCVERRSAHTQELSGSLLCEQTAREVLAGLYRGDALSQQAHKAFLVATGVDLFDSPKALLLVLRRADQFDFAPPPIAPRGCVAFTNQLSKNLRAHLFCHWDGALEPDLRPYQLLLAQRGDLCGFCSSGKRQLSTALMDAQHQLVMQTGPKPLPQRPETGAADPLHAALQRCLSNSDPSELDALLYNFWRIHYDRGTQQSFAQFAYECTVLIHRTYEAIGERRRSFMSPSEMADGDVAKAISQSGSACEAFFALKHHMHDIVGQLGRGAGKNILSMQALSHIHNHYSSDLSLNKLAQIISVSPSYLSKLFKEDIGTPFTDYLIRYRMDIAQRMLAVGDKKVYEVAAMVGYQDVAQFTKMFKKTFGCSPKQVAKGGQLQ